MTADLFNHLWQSTLFAAGGAAPRAIVLEFKTGAPLPWHQIQLAQYVAAAQALLPGTAVEGALIYAPDRQ